MTLRQWRQALRSGAWLLSPGERVAARTEFQRTRLTAAVTMARIYLSGDMKTEQMGVMLSVTDERAAQMVRLGISYMQRAGWLRPAAAPDNTGS